MKIYELQNRNISVHNCIGTTQYQEQIVVYIVRTEIISIYYKEVRWMRETEAMIERGLGRGRIIHSLGLLFFIAIIW